MAAKKSKIPLDARQAQAWLGAFHLAGTSANGRGCQCPLYPQKLPRKSLTDTSAKGHNQTFTLS